MGKNIVVALFLCACALAGYVLFTREPRKVSNVVINKKDPRVSLEDFTIFRYKGHQAEATFSGKLGLYVDPNILEIYGSVRGMRHNSTKREYVSAEAATVYFNTNGLAQLMETQAKVTRAEVQENVNIGMRYNRVVTEYAEYLPTPPVLQSDRKVELKGPTGDFVGQKGFHYLLDQESIKIFGPIEGVIQGDAIRTL